MRVVADTNTIISAFLWGGKPFQLLQLAVSQQIVLVTTDALVEELLAVLSRDKFSRRLEKVWTSASEVVVDYCYLSEVVVPAEITLLSLMIQMMMLFWLVQSVVQPIISLAEMSIC